MRFEMGFRPNFWGCHRPRAAPWVVRFPWALPKATMTMAVGQLGASERRRVRGLTFDTPFLMAAWWVVTAASGVKGNHTG